MAFLKVDLMPTQIVDIRKPASATSDNLELGLGKGKLKVLAIGIGTDGAHCSGLAYMRSSKGRSEDCPLIVGTQLSYLNDAIWSGEIKIHRPIQVIAAFRGLTVGNIIEIKAIIEV